MYPDLKDSVVLITGGGSGIGREASKRFASEGAHVVVADLHEANAHQTIQIIDQHGGARSVGVTCDAAAEEGVKGAVDRAIAEFGRLDHVFLNAGAAGAFGKMAHINADHFDKTVAVLLKSVFLGMKHCAAIMQPGSTMVATASIAGLGGGGAPHIYSAAKAAVVNLVRTAAVELAPAGIRVNGVAPGLIDTPLLSEARADVETWTTLSAQPAMGRAGNPEEIAAAVAWLCSKESSYVCGHTLLVDGGILAAGPRVIPGEGRPGIMGYSPGNTGEEPELTEV